MFYRHWPGVEAEKPAAIQAHELLGALRVGTLGNHKSGKSRSYCLTFGKAKKFALNR
jgi:hypothetical protein